tara:strand:+ start:621 stop:1145 length:525 start_codon:yes stop_codon:yes gene_type:complete
MKIYNDFLDNCDFNKVRDCVYGDDIRWEKTLKVFGGDENNYQYVHLAYSELVPLSNFFNVSSCIFNKLQVLSLYRIKINMSPSFPERLYSDFHYDWNSSRGTHENPIPCAIMKTGILYLNTNDGYTEFENGEIVESVENRFVEFPSNIRHRGVSQTNSDWRGVINFNYFVGDPR